MDSLSTPETNGLLKLWQGKYLALGWVAFGLALAGVYTFIKKPVYEGSAILLLPTVQGSGANSLAQQLGISVSAGSQSNIYMFKQILESSRARSMVAQQIGLSRGEVKLNSVIEENSTANSILITYLDPDQARAKKAVGSYISSLRKIHSELSIPSKKSQAQALQTSLEKRKSELSDAEERLRIFQLSAKTAPALGGNGVAISASRYSEQLRGLEIEREKLRSSVHQLRTQLERAKGASIELPNNLPTARQWREKLVQLEYELKVAEISGGPLDPKVVKLKSQIEITKSSLAQESERYLQALKSGVVDPSLESGIASFGAATSTLAGIEAQISALQRLTKVAPTEALTYQRMVNEIAMLSKLVESQRTQLEQAKWDAQADPNRWEVLDEPEVSAEPVNKNYIRNMAVGGVAGLVLAFFAISSRGAKAK